MLAVDDVPLGVGAGGGGAGAGAPGESMVPPSAGMASTRVRAETAQVRRSLFTFLYLPEGCKNFCIKLVYAPFCCKGVRDCAKVNALLGETSFLAFSCKKEPFSR